jgi:hypothetical protein
VSEVKALRHERDAARGHAAAAAAVAAQSAPEGA